MIEKDYIYIVLLIIMIIVIVVIVIIREYREEQQQQSRAVVRKEFRSSHAFDKIQSKSTDSNLYERMPHKINSSIINHMRELEKRKSLISNRLLEVIKTVSCEVDSLKTKTDHRVLLCEANMLFTVIALDIVTSRCQDKKLVIEVVNGLFPEVKEYILDEYSYLFKQLDIDNYIDDRLLVFRSELSEFSMNPRYLFPKCTCAFYSLEFHAQLQDKICSENITINTLMPIWVDLLEKQLQECLRKYYGN